MFNPRSTSSPLPLSSGTLRSRQRKLNVRSLNKEFNIFRGNAVQKRRFRNQKFEYHSDRGDGEDRVRLLSDEEETAGDGHASAASCPQYVRRAEALSLELDGLRSAVEKLEAEISRDTRRPLFDDDDGGGGDGGAAAEALTQEVQGGVRMAHRNLGRLKELTTGLDGLEGRLAKNMVMAMTNKLKDIMEKFGAAQSSHLQKTKARESKTQRYFQDFVEPEEDALNMLDASSNGRISTQELVQLEETSRALQSREKEINKVVKSISDLNVIFQDLARMVTEQGEVLDRIDCNIETTSIKVKAGVQELKKAERYQQKNRKMKCIVILAVIVVILLIVLVIKVS